LAVPRSAVDEFQEFLYDATAALILAIDGLMRVQAYLGQGLENARRMGVTIPGPQLFFAGGDPRFNSPVFAPRPIEEALQNCMPGGRYSDLVGHGWIVNVFGTWEERFRGEIAQELGLSERLACDPMGDLRRMRNDIAHHLGIATRGNTGRCSVLTWFQPGTVISPRREHAQALLEVMEPYLVSWRRAPT
jgi:hypothetical protein